MVYLFLRNSLCRDITWLYLAAFMLVVSASLNDNSVTAVIIKFIIYPWYGNCGDSDHDGLIDFTTIGTEVSAQLYGFYPKIANVVIFLSGLYMAYYWYFGSGGICTF